MGMKKDCSCGYWNKEQEECLYNGSGCAKDEQDRLGVTKEWIDRKVMAFHPVAQKIFDDKILVGVWSTKPLRDFIRLIVKEILGK